MELSRGRDLRKRGWFWLDDEYLNGYAKHLGTTASCVYISLCRHVGKDQTCFPSMEKIAEELGLGSRNTVSIAIKKLAEFNIVEIKEEIDHKTKRRKNNIYLLLDKEYWKPKPCTKTEHGQPMHDLQAEPCTISDESHALKVSSKETHINNTQIKDSEDKSSQLISLIFKEFESINPAVKRMYGNKTQREACNLLIETYGFERVINVIQNTLPRTNKMTANFFPNIGTPLQLFEKWQKLEDAIISYREKNKITKNKVAF